MSVRKGIILFLTITVSVALFIIIKTIDKETWYLIAHLHPRVIMMTLLWVLLTWTMDFFTLKVLARSTDGDFTLKEGIDIVLINYFGAAITPLQSGGGPFQVYLLYRAGIPIGKGIAITLMRTILLLIILSIGGPIILHYYPNLLPGVWGKIAYYYVISFVVGVWTVIFFSIYKPRAIKKSAFWLARRFKKRRIIKKKHYYSILKFISRELDNYHNNLELLFSKKRKLLFLAILFSMIRLFSYFMVLPTLIYGLGLHVSLIKILSLQVVFFFILFFVPSPGGSGVAEGGGAILLSTLIPSSIAGILSVGWRFFNEYIGIILGGIVALNILRKVSAEEILNITKNQKDREWI